MKNYGVGCLCPAGSQEESKAAGAGNLFGVLFDRAGIDNPARSRREAQTYLVCFPLPLSKGGQASMSWPLSAWQGVHVPAIIQLLEPAVWIRSHLKTIESHQRCQWNRSFWLTLAPSAGGCLGAIEELLLLSCLLTRLFRRTTSI